MTELLLAMAPTNRNECFIYGRLDNKPNTVTRPTGWLGTAVGLAFVPFLQSVGRKRVGRYAAAVYATILPPLLQANLQITRFIGRHAEEGCVMATVAMKQAKNTVTPGRKRISGAGGSARAALLSPSCLTAAQLILTQAPLDRLRI